MDAPASWDDDPKLVALLGEQGTRALRALFDAFPDAIGLLWSIRDDAGRIVDFDFGYGNPEIMRLFDLPRSQTGRYTLLEALPEMRDDGSFAQYVRVCDTGEPFVDEITYDTRFGEGWIRGTLLRRTAKLGDGLLVLVMGTPLVCGSPLRNRCLPGRGRLRRDSGRAKSPGISLVGLVP